MGKIIKKDKNSSLNVGFFCEDWSGSMIER